VESKKTTKNMEIDELKQNARRHKTEAGDNVVEEEDEDLQEISPSPITLKAMQIFNEIGYAITEDGFITLHGGRGAALQLTKLTEMRLIKKAGVDINGDATYVLGKIGNAVLTQGPGRYRIEKYGKVVKIGESWGCGAAELAAYKASLNGKAHA
jgi:hypothetical protein